LADDSIARFMASLARRQWEWGKTDCLMVLADWINERRGFDPAAAWRGAYSTQEECDRILKRSGGIVALVDMVLHGICPRTDKPEAGDIAIVRTPKRTGAICVSADDRALLSVDRGLMIVRASILPTVAAWRV
jgi:hypothetical protein